MVRFSYLKLLNFQTGAWTAEPTARSHINPVKHLANLEIIMRCIRQFYEDQLGEIILHPLHVHLIVHLMLLALLLGSQSNVERTSVSLKRLRFSLARFSKHVH